MTAKRTCPVKVVSTRLSDGDQIEVECGADVVEGPCDVYVPELSAVTTIEELARPPLRVCGVESPRMMIHRPDLTFLGHVYDGYVCTEGHPCPVAEVETA